MNAELVKQASEIVLNANVLINLISRRVRQLNAGGGGTSRALVADSGNSSAADIALREIIEGKMSFEMPQFIPLTRPSRTNGSRPKQWAKA
jgi:DNA-directed RNA polymerase subunit omega